MCVCVCTHVCTQFGGRGNWLVSGLTQYGNPNSSIMGVFSFRLSAAAEDKIKKKLERERERKHEISQRKRTFKVRQGQGAGQCEVAQIIHGEDR